MTRGWLALWLIWMDCVSLSRKILKFKWKCGSKYENIVFTKYTPEGQYIEKIWGKHGC